MRGMELSSNAEASHRFTMKSMSVRPRPAASRLAEALSHVSPWKLCFVWDDRDYGDCRRAEGSDLIACGPQGRTSVRTRGRDGRVDTREQLHNLDRDSASQFDAEWLSHAERGLPGRSASGGNSGGRRIPIRGADDPPSEQQHTRIEEVVRLGLLFGSGYRSVRTHPGWLPCPRGQVRHVPLWRHTSQDEALAGLAERVFTRVE
jgi:hypothetical protein